MSRRDEAALEWIESLRLSGRKPSTISHYRARLRQVLGAVTVDTWPIPADDISRALAAAGAGRAPDTIRANTIVTQQWGKWLVTRSYQPVETWAAVSWPKPGSRQRDELPTDEQSRAITAAGPPAWARIYRALRLTGARPGELCRAQISDLDRASRVIRLADHKTAGKTGRPRVIACGHRAMAEILEESIGLRANGCIFLSDRGQPWTVAHVSRIFRLIRDRLSLPRSLCLYLTRHEHATKLYRSCKDVKAVADALGHSNLQTTRRYTRVSTEELNQAQSLIDE